jgi:hypothetical protein
MNGGLTSIMKEAAPDVLSALLQHLLGGSDVSCQMHKRGHQAFWPRIETWTS